MNHKLSTKQHNRAKRIYSKLQGKIKQREAVINNTKTHIDRINKEIEVLNKELEEILGKWRLKQQRKAIAAARLVGAEKEIQSREVAEEEDVEVDDIIHSNANDLNSTGNNIRV